MVLPHEALELLQRVLDAPAAFVLDTTSSTSCKELIICRAASRSGRPSIGGKWDSSCRHLPQASFCSNIGSHALVSSLRDKFEIVLDGQGVASAIASSSAQPEEPLSICGGCMIGRGLLEAHVRLDIECAAFLFHCCCQAIPNNKFEGTASG